MENLELKDISNKINIPIRYLTDHITNLKNNWKFEKIEDNKTKVHFTIKFEFNNILYQKMTEFFYDLIENQLIF